MSVTQSTRESTPPPDEPTPDVRPNYAGLVLLVLLAVGGTALAIATQSTPVIVFVFAIVFMVMLHEAGHYVVAKKAGMKVTQFFFGFGPRLWSFHRRETEYGVRALPLGGFVKIVGMSNMERDIDPADEPRTYRQQSYGKRVAVALAGVATHFMVAFLVLTVIYAFIGMPQPGEPTLRIDSITNGSAAERAGFETGDELVSIDGRPVTRWEELPPYVRERAGQQLSFVVERDGRNVTLNAVPDQVQQGDVAVGFLGVGPATAVERTNLFSAMGKGAQETGEFTVETVKAMVKIFSPASLGNYVDHVRGDVTPEQQVTERPISMVGAARLADQAAEYDVPTALRLFVALNIFVAVVNLLPLLPFDGGHVAIATYERVRSRKGRRYHADVAKMMPVAVLVTAFFILLGVTSIWLDVVNPVQNPFQ